MSRREDDIVALAAEVAGCARKEVDRGDLLGSTGLETKGAKRYLEAYAMRFGVDMRGYRWWFHHRDEGPFATPLVALDDDRNEIRIPLTAAMLDGFADRGRWDLEYPPHRLGLRSVRWAIVVFGICALGLGYALFLR